MTTKGKLAGGTAVAHRRSTRQRKPVDMYAPDIARRKSIAKATTTRRPLDAVQRDRSTAKISKKTTGVKLGSRAAKPLRRTTTGEGKRAVEEVPRVYRVYRDGIQASNVPEAVNKESNISEAVLLECFTQSVLQCAGALETEGAQLPSLTIGIHPIWQYSNFTWYGEMSDQETIELYAAITPALRLATHWITAAHLEAFWLPLWFPRHVDERSDRHGTHVVAPIPPDCIEELAGRTTAWFEDLGKSKINWQFQRLNFQQHGWATTPPNVKAFKAITGTIRGKGDPGHMTLIHHDFQWMLRHPDSKSDTSEKLRLLFYLAVQLVRELVWHVYLHKWWLDHHHSPKTRGDSNVYRHSRRDDDSPPISPRTIARPKDIPATRPPASLPAIAEVLTARPIDPQPPERSRVRYQFDSNGHSDALDAAWETFMFKGAIWRINPVAGPLPFPGVPYGFAIQVIEAKWAANDVEYADDDDDSTDVYDPMPMSHINNLFSAKYWSDIVEDVNSSPPLTMTGRFCAKKPIVEPASEIVRVAER